MLSRQSLLPIEVDPPVRRLGEHTARWLINGAVAYAEIEQAIQAARDSVRLETYLMRDHGPAKRILNQLISAARRGVRVRVMVDAFGSEALPPEFFVELTRAGGEARIFNPRPLLRLSFRDHRKLLVCDDNVAIVGGFNIGPEYDGNGVTDGWRDLGLRLGGPTASHLAASFDQMFALASFDAKWIKVFRAETSHSASVCPAVELLVSGPFVSPPLLRQQMYLDLERGRDVSIAAAYFVPSRRIRQALAGCAQRGRVRLLLAGRTDVPVARLASEHTYPALLEAGVSIYEYQPQILHSKLLIIDDVLYIGSSNLDRRSLHINYELMLRMQWPALVQDALEIFSADLQHSRLIDARHWDRERSSWRSLKARSSYWLLARLDPVIARRKLRALS